MKHIKRKFLFHDFLQKTDLGQINGFETMEPKTFTQDALKSVEKGRNTILHTESGEKVFCFIHNNKGKRTLIPVPDFALVNYNWAYNMNIQRKEHQTDLLKNLEDLSSVTEASNTFAYNFQGCASMCIIGLFTAIECYINDIIPENFEYVVPQTRKTEIYNKEQIQRNIPFMEKLTKVLPQAYEGKNFFQHQTPTNAHIYKLKDLRDDIVHIKSDKTGENNIDILKRLLTFQYDDTFKSVFKLYNFYREAFIEECPCSQDY
jgi:hypothetical protein